MSVELSTSERATRELFASNAAKKVWENGGGDHATQIAAVFKCKYYAALSADEVSRMGSALASWSEVQDLTKTLEKFVAAKILRKFTRHGSKFYEVNYK